MICIHRAHVCVCTLAVILPNFRFIYENAWKTCLGAELSLVGDYPEASRRGQAQILQARGS